jgi:hypothetical protein
LSDKDAGKKAAAQAEQTRESIRQFLAGLEPESLELALSGDPGLTREAIESSYMVEMACFQVIKVFCEYLDGLSPEERSAVLERHIQAFDGSAVAAATNAWSALAMKVHEERPDLVEATFPAIDSIFKDTDFGKGREALSGLLDYFTKYMTYAIEVMMENPVVIANIVGIIPPLVNSMIKIVSVGLEKTNLPPEILASALFNTLTALDAEELGRVMTTMSRMIVDLHAGNYILGHDEPRLRAVFTDFMKRVLDNVDNVATTGALVAVAEDAEVIAGVLVELTARDPEMVVLMAKAAASVHNIIARIIANGLSETAAWPDELLVRVGEEMRATDTVEVGRAIDSAVTFALRLHETNPWLHSHLLTGALQEINTERLELLLGAASLDIKEAMLANPGIRRALEPEEIGRRLNERLVRFNNSAAGRPGGIRDYVTRMLSVVETEELEKAARTVSEGMMDATLATGARVRMLLKLGAKNAWRFIKLVTKALNAK